MVHGGSAAPPASPALVFQISRPSSPPQGDLIAYVTSVIRSAPAGSGRGEEEEEGYVGKWRAEGGGKNSVFPEASPP